MKIVDSSPHPSMLIESLRDFGYSLESALADIIDNSITAGATRIDILANYAEGEEFLSVVDNGSGMTDTKLLEAMRLGSQSPLDKREKSDLGRFGLGLKTASFSQCRNLTVLTRNNGKTYGATWDLDYVARENRWNVIIVEDFGALPGFDLLGNSGTVIIWRNLDRIREKSDRKSNEFYFEERMSDLVDHLALVYHRFLRREGNHAGITIAINNRPIDPIDPFMTDHPGTQALYPETVTYSHHSVVLTGYTLPPYNKMSGEEWKRLGGKEGHVRNQGFYVYRERRLIIWGTWFGLAPKSEANKLARVKVDIGNDTDEDWKIDVLKSSATPPLPVRTRMKELIGRLAQDSRRAHSGVRPQSSISPIASGWLTQHEDNLVRFVPNPDHPMISELKTSLPAAQQQALDEILSMLASSLPIDQIHSRITSKPEEVNQSKISDEGLALQVGHICSALLDSGMTIDHIRTTLRYEEPFRSSWDKVMALIDSIDFSNEGITLT